VSTIRAANNGNNIRLLRPSGELEGKIVSICLLYFPKVYKLNNKNFYDLRFFAFATGGKP
jgi:hypothetical protein